MKIDMANNIKKLRKEKGLTQKELAALLNVSDKAVSKWERGDNMPEVSLIPVIAQELGCSVEYLFNQEKNINIKSIDVKEYLQNRLNVKMQSALLLSFLLIPLNMLSFRIEINNLMFSIIILIFAIIFFIVFESQQKAISSINLTSNSIFCIGIIIFSWQLFYFVFKEIFDKANDFTLSRNSTVFGKHLPISWDNYLVEIFFLLSVCIVLTFVVIKLSQKDIKIVKVGVLMFVCTIINYIFYVLIIAFKYKFMFDNSIIAEKVREKVLGVDKIIWFKYLNISNLALSLLIGLILYILVKNKIDKKFYLLGNFIIGVIYSIFSYNIVNPLEHYPHGPYGAFLNITAAQNLKMLPLFIFLCSSIAYYYINIKIKNKEATSK